MAISSWLLVLICTPILLILVAGLIRWVLTLYLNSRRCVFCDILNRAASTLSFSSEFLDKTPTTILHRDPEFIVIRDKFPAGEVHLLAIPTDHAIRDYTRFPKPSVELLKRMKKVGTKLAENLVTTKDAPASLVVRFTRPWFVSIFHAHLHFVSRPLKKNLMSQLNFKQI